MALGFPHCCSVWAQFLAPDNKQLWIQKIEMHRPGGSGQSSVRITALERGPTSVEQTTISTSATSVFATSVYFRRKAPEIDYDFNLRVAIERRTGAADCYAPQVDRFAPKHVLFKIGQLP